MHADNPTFRFLDFCAGIGAGHAAAVKLGGGCVGYSEIDPKAKRTYRMLHDLETLWEPLIDLGDLTKMDPNEVPDFDVMLGGFPCQTFSIVGRREGFKDPRGQIIFALSDILAAKKPNYFLLENVKGLMSHNKGETLKQILIELRSAGYKVTWKLVSSQDYGIPQMRERVYFVGIREELVSDTFEFQFPEKKKKQKQLRHILTSKDPKFAVTAEGYAYLEKYLNNKYNKPSGTTVEVLKELPNCTIIDTRQSDLRLFEKVAPTLRSGRHGLLYARDGELRKISGLEGLGLQGFDKSYQKRVYGVAETDLLHQVGNAFTVDVVHTLLESLFEQVKAPTPAQ
ncbi:DNA (cytosine-5-)-methyltransferase [Pelagicoccus sp. SDUM812002]|uniref:DNA (cytosine-5-)-methyltransferase n=1 Tax=Pelagicoccus sp. SDUM812002 TaxID=3041266 RepID=UPI00280FE367|nr:DNA (cytosine-5-)-methyltransferase [Pelagicoccus sp. SDUM812002]MDQ8185751.1 DNA (cytosine-5-)-methyltransferase [Pelagicoccus sp. SDUM812002]